MKLNKIEISPLLIQTASSQAKQQGPTKTALVDEYKQKFAKLTADLATRTTEL